MDKRTFLKTTALAGAGAFLLGNQTAGAASATNSFAADEALPFPQLPLPYAYNALEPYIDAQTMEIHYSRHHATYTKNFNAAVAEQKIATKDIAEIFKSVSKYPAVIRNQGGGYYNHNFFWSIMAPNAGGEATGEAGRQITVDFGSFAKFKEDFTKAAGGQFGSGWAWLIVKDGKLQIINLPNQDNPWMDIAPIQGTPILNIDVWEHAYYLKYQNRRAEYIAAFWNVINWKQVDENFLKSKK
jgi:superoxide dismutase, Fe-Mn family